MKILIALNHPAHYHLFKNLYNGLKNKKHNVIFVIKDKDILENLLIQENIDFIRLVKKRIGKKRYSIITKGLFDLALQDTNLFLFVKKYNPKLMIGTDYSITHIGKLLKIPSIVFNEDDFEINKLFCFLAYPFCTCIITPSICKVGRYFNKRIGYDGYQKLSYLHPSVFKCDRHIIDKYIDSNRKYFLIRLVSF